MTKPSIFSKDYERKMKRRKRNITVITILVVIIAAFIFVKVKVENTDFSNIRAKIQAWVDSGKPQEETVEQEKAPEESQDEKPVEEAPKELAYDFTMPNGVIVKAKYSEENGVKTFQGIEENNGVTYSVNPSKNKIIITDQNQNLLLGNIDGTSKDLTKNEYITSKGKSINKNQILQTYPQNIWHSNAKFVDDNIIIYYSNLPYVGSGVQDKYFWLVDSNTGEHHMIPSLVGTQVSIGNLNPANGIEVSLNGYNYYVKADGTFIQNDGTTDGQNNQQNTQNQNVNQNANQSTENQNVQ